MRSPLFFFGGGLRHGDTNNFLRATAYNLKDGMIDVNNLRSQALISATNDRKRAL